jgi:hypothetical protein
MNQFYCKVPLLVLLFVGAPALPAGGQDGGVAIVERIKERRTEVDASRRAQIWRVGHSGPARKEALLQLHDVVRMRRQVFLDLSFFGDDLESRVILGTRNLTEQGNYEIRENTVDELGGLEIIVRQGVMVVEHGRGRLSAIAAGIRTDIFGTTALLFVDDTGQTGRVYLPEGTIGFPDWPGLERLEAGQAGRSWALTAGAEPREIPLGPDARRRWERELGHNASSVWDPVPFWQRPHYYIPAAAIVVGGGILLLNRSSETVHGYVIISLP